MKKAFMTYGNLETIFLGYMSFKLKFQQLETENSTEHTAGAS